MKNTLMLVFLFNCAASFGQKAISGSVLLQNNGQEFTRTTTEALSKTDSRYRHSQFPTFAVSLFKFAKTGGYSKIQLSGWRYNKIRDVDETTIPSIGLEEVTRGEDTYLAGGRIGVAKGFKLNSKNDGHSFFLEADLSTGWQYADYQPLVPTVYPRTIWGTSTRLGVNLVFQKNFKMGFVRLAGLVPALQFNTESHTIGNPSMPLSQQRNRSSYLDYDAWKQAGLEIGGGVYLSK